LLPENHEKNQANLLAADLSRPYRTFREDERVKSRGPTGRKRKPENQLEPAQKVNWRAPHLAQQIVDAQRAVKSWSPAVIVCYLRVHHIAMFSRLSSQVLGTYIDRSSDQPRWKDTLLESIGQKGYRPGGQVTRRGILVRLTLRPTSMHA
jgi:hypothetical protein